MSKKSKIYFSGGGKGGVGKTMATIALTDFLSNNSEANSVTLVESDDSNPDAFKAYEKVTEVKKKVINLDTQAGWIALMNEMPTWAKNGEQVVINTAARATQSLKKHLNDLTTGAKQLNIDVRMIWVINRQRDSLTLIHDLLQTVEIDTTIAKNLYWGDSEKFVLYDKSELKKKVQTIEIPDLNDEIADKIYINRLPLHAMDEFHYGEQIALQRFRNDVASSFALIK